MNAPGFDALLFVSKNADSMQQTAFRIVKKDGQKLVFLKRNHNSLNLILQKPVRRGDSEEGKANA